MIDVGSTNSISQACIYKLDMNVGACSLVKDCERLNPQSRKSRGFLFRKGPAKKKGRPLEDPKPCATKCGLVGGMLRARPGLQPCDKHSWAAVPVPPYNLLGQMQKMKDPAHAFRGEAKVARVAQTRAFSTAKAPFPKMATLLPCPASQLQG